MGSLGPMFFKEQLLEEEKVLLDLTPSCQFQV
jgi:hypothetical protein